MKKVKDGDIDVAIGLISLQFPRALYLSETKAFAIIPLVIVVPPGAEYGEIEKLTRPFNIIVWFMIISLICLAGIITMILKNSSSGAYNFVVGRDLKHPFHNVVAITFGVSQNKLPARNFSRFILMNFILYCLILRSAYQGGVFKSVKSNDRKPAIASLDEMMAKNVKFYMYGTLEPRTEHFKFYKRRVVYPNELISDYRMKTLDPSFDGVVFTYLDQVLYLNQLNYKNYTFQVCKERFMANQVVFYFRKSHYLVEDVSEIIGMMLTNGMIKQIQESYYDSNLLKRLEKSKEPKVLTLKDSNGAFKVFAFGCLISITLFALELLTKFERLRCFKLTLDYVQ